MDELIGKAVKIRPKEGYLIFDPVSLDKIPDTGATVLFSLYWVKLINTDQVELVPDPPKAERATVGVTLK